MRSVMGSSSAPAEIRVAESDADFEGWARVKTTVLGPLARTCSAVRMPFQSQEKPFFRAIIRWNEKTTSSAVSSLPSWNLMPLRIWNV